MTTLRLSRDVVEDAQSIGCGSAEIETNAVGRTRVHCSCGYMSTYRNNRGDAMQALGHHLQKRVAEYRTAHGQRPPRLIRVKTPAELRAARVSQSEEATAAG